ncbi:MAG: polysaccharide deacetylase family protein [Spongiibacteraceae bacterium]
MTSRPLPPARFIQLFLASHAVALIAFFLWPAQWAWIAGGLLSLHALVAAAGLWPTCALLGPNITHLPKEAAARGEIAITIDDGPDPHVTPEVLRILREHGARATFFCIGERAHAHADLCREIIAAGHAVESHGQRHRTLTALCGPRGWQREIVDAQHTLKMVTGRAPTFFRPIAGLRNPFLEPLLQRLGLRLVSWTRRGYDTRAVEPARVYEKLTRNLTGGEILLLHDGNAARSANGIPIILDVLPRLLDELARRSLKTVTLREACTPV